MPVQKINIGTVPNDHTGSPLRTGGQIINDNTDWLTGKIGTDDRLIKPSGTVGGRLIDLTAANDTIYEDYQLPLTVLNTGAAAANALTWVNNVGRASDKFLYLEMNLATGKTVFWPTMQTPHSWWPESRIYPHLHCTTSIDSASSIDMTFDVFWIIEDIDGTSPLAATKLNNTPTSIPAHSQWKHNLLDIPSTGIDMAGHPGPSTIIRMRYELKTQTVATPIYIMSFDIHIRIAGTPPPFTP